MQSRKAFLTFLVCSIVLITLIQEVRAQTLWDLIRNFLFPPLEPAVTGGTGGCVSGSCKCSCGANEDYVGSCANSACGPGGGKCCAPKTTTTTQPTTTTTRPPTTTTIPSCSGTCRTGNICLSGESSQGQDGCGSYQLCCIPTTTTTSTTTTQPTTANCNNNGHCDGWPEDCGTCPGDCKCGPNDYCPQNWCIPKPTSSTTTTTISGGTTTTQPPYGQCSVGSSCSCTYCGSNEEYTGSCLKTGCLNGEGYCCKPKPAAYCGNGKCDGPQENCENCPQDCPCGANELCASGGVCIPKSDSVCCESIYGRDCRSRSTCSGISAKIIGSCPCPGTSVCGDGTCTPDKEDCYTCPGDCLCGTGDECRDRRCQSKTTIVCGDNYCTPDKEDCGTCLQDCPCGENDICQDHHCVPKSTVQPEVCAGSCFASTSCAADCESRCKATAGYEVKQTQTIDCDASHAGKECCCVCGSAGGTPPSSGACYSSYWKIWIPNGGTCCHSQAGSDSKASDCHYDLQDTVKCVNGQFVHLSWSPCPSDKCCDVQNNCVDCPSTSYEGTICCKFVNGAFYVVVRGDICPGDNFFKVSREKCGSHSYCPGSCKASCDPNTEKDFGTGAAAGCTDTPGGSYFVRIGQSIGERCCAPLNAQIPNIPTPPASNDCSSYEITGVGGVKLKGRCDVRCTVEDEWATSMECAQKEQAYCCKPTKYNVGQYIPSLICQIPSGKTTGTCEPPNPYLSGVWNYAPSGTCTSQGQSCQANSDQCANTDTSCGFYPNCINCKDLEHCRGGYWDSYDCYRQACGTGVSRCDEGCCNNFDSNAHCVSDGRHPPLCQVVPGPNVCCCYITAEKTKACISKTSCETEGSCISSCPCGGGTTTTTTLPLGCTCTSWSNAGCGQGGCASDQMRQTRSCTGSNCPSTSRCVGPSYGSWTNLGCGASCGASTCSATQQCQKRTDSYGCAADQYQCVSAVECGGTTTTSTTTTTLPCLTEGQSGAVVPNHLPCCSGLNYIFCDQPNPTTGICPTDRCLGTFICAKCGIDGICGLGENKCNCPQDCIGPTTTTTLPTGIQCDECFANSKCKCSLTTGCTNGVWALQNTEGNPLSSILSQSIPPATIEFSPNATGTIAVKAVCWTNNQVLTYTLQVKERFVKCDDICSTKNNCYCSVTGCLSGTFTAVLGDTVLKWKDPIGSTSYSTYFIPEKIGTVNVDVTCNNPVKTGTAQIPVTGKPSGKFSGTNFKSKQVDDSYKLTLDYVNNLNEDAIIVFTKNGDAVNKKFTAEPGSGTASATFDCDTLGSGDYMISWKAYKSSNKEDPIAWSIPDEMKEIQC